MKKLIYLLSITFLLLQSCSSKDEDNNLTVAKSATINVKYEVIASSGLRTFNGQPNQQIIMTYTNGAGQQQIETSNYTDYFRNWEKSLTLTNTNRPLQLRLVMSQSNAGNNYKAYIILERGGTVKINLYLDGILTKSETITSSSLNDGSGWYYVAINDFIYTIQ